MQYPYNFKPPGQQQVPNSPLMPGAAPQPGMGIAPIAPPPQAGQQGKSPAEIAALAAYLQNFGLQLEEGELTDQMAYADALRQKTPEGRDSGRVYTAANPLEHLGAGMQNWAAMKMREKAAADRRTVNESRGKNVGGVGAKILNNEEI